MAHPLEQGTEHLNKIMEKEKFKVHSREIQQHVLYNKATNRRALKATLLFLGGGGEEESQKIRFTTLLFSAIAKACFFGLLKNISLEGD